MRLRSAVALTLLFICGASAVTGLVRAGDAGQTEETGLSSRASVPLGGLSGIEVSDDGSTFLALSDDGHLARGHLQRKDGRLIGAVVEEILPLQEPERRWRHGIHIDSEGLAMMPDGRIAVSLEAADRIWIGEIGGPMTQLPAPPDMTTLNVNKRYEALAVDPQGRLYTLPERPADPEAPFPVWRYEHGAWQLLRHIPRTGNYLPVGADFGPNGDFYLLERNFAYGFRNRLLRFDLSNPGDNGEILWEGPWDNVNYEGVAIWQREDGTEVAVLVSDNNFLKFLRQSILEIPLAPRPVRG